MIVAPAIAQEASGTGEDPRELNGYFERIPLWAEDGKRFEIIADANCTTHETDIGEAANEV